MVTLSVEARRTDALRRKGAAVRTATVNDFAAAEKAGDLTRQRTGSIEGGQRMRSARAGCVLSLCEMPPASCQSLPPPAPYIGKLRRTQCTYIFTVQGISPTMSCSLPAARVKLSTSWMIYSSLLLRIELQMVLYIQFNMFCESQHARYGGVPPTYFHCTSPLSYRGLGAWRAWELGPQNIGLNPSDPAPAGMTLNGPTQASLAKVSS